MEELGYSLVSLDGRAISTARRLVEAQMPDRKQHLDRALRENRSKAAGAGAMGSSRFVVEAFEICAREIEIRMDLVWRAIYRAVTAAGVVAAPQLAAEREQVLASFREVVLPDVLDAFDKEKGVGRINWDRTLNQEWEKALEKQRAEAELFALNLASLTQNAGRGSAVINVYAPVGAIQTGDRSVATFAQTFNASEREAVQAALSQLREAVEPLSHSSDGKAVLEMILDAEAESRKAEPNRPKVSALLSGISTGIQTLASAGPAYEAARAALLALGINMP